MLAVVAHAAALCSVAYTVGIVGAQGRLGRELVLQTLEERHWHARALVRRPDEPVLRPSRDGWLREPPGVRAPLRSDALSVRSVDAPDALEGCDALVLALSGAPFEADTSTAVVRDLCARLPPTCERVCLVSAFGVGDSLRRADPGIRVMDAWYLRDTYAAKHEQEALVRALAVPQLVLRPRVLSHAPVPLNPIATTREDLARRILSWIAQSPASAPSSGQRRAGTRGS
jgi:putative NADH-flavin reductase